MDVVGTEDALAVGRQWPEAPAILVSDRLLPCLRCSRLRSLFSNVQLSSQVSDVARRQAERVELR